ncbi:putative acetylxylan esterase [Lentinula aciculospora]|uniref:Carboxylic ester hydrolase n=1 Tax=Lentinula aciculospora TaxID=153920 RepID=A0A9W9A0I5_9AGAR|nr:putative acetylxylan esterase [Lentinula aciculospora]
MIVAVFCCVLVDAASQPLTQITANIGPKPNNVGMFLYKPAKSLASPLPLTVAIHQCTGSAQGYLQSTQYANLADEYGFLAIYPNSPRSRSCFDVNTPQTLSHNSSSDSQGSASMVSYAISTYEVDSTKVFVPGMSSGAMMTNDMAGSYPNLFAAASGYSGVPFGCFAGSSSWNSQCSEGQLVKTAEQWGDGVRAAYPGYTDSRPRMMLWHGTADMALYYANYGEEIKEWTDVLGVSQTPTTTTTQNNPQSGYTKTTYGSEVVGYSATRLSHTVPVHETVDLVYSTGTPTTTLPVSTSPVTTTSSSAGSTGTGTSGWSGPISCVTGSTFQVINSYYSQCLP